MPRQPTELDAETAASLLRRQDVLQAEARQIVRELELQTLLGQAGPVAEHGSALSGLMAWPDLDFGVTSPGLDPARAFGIMEPQLTHPPTTMVRFTNETGARAFAGDPCNERLFFMVSYEHTTGRVWKIDIPFWLFPEPRDERQYHERIVDRLTPETRLAILCLKDLWNPTPVYPTEVGSVDIYTAVLDAGVRSSAEFDDYLRARDKPPLVEVLAVRRKARDA
ncbi:MAG: hypothetical protein WEC79_07385 [Thermomicrobiales bacterium]